MKVLLSVLHLHFYMRDVLFNHIQFELQLLLLLLDLHALSIDCDRNLRVLCFQPLLLAHKVRESVMQIASLAHPR